MQEYLARATWLLDSLATRLLDSDSRETKPFDSGEARLLASLQDASGFRGDQVTGFRTNILQDTGATKL